jgi:inositol-1,3,4-trisphosphate 5/6-kinase/inositol-tetrakisphosphate 1-kinase
MRLNGEIGEEEEKKVAECLNTQAYSISGGFSQPQSQKLVVGYALTSKKKKSFLQPKLLCLARYKSHSHRFLSIYTIEIHNFCAILDDSLLSH